MPDTHPLGAGVLGRSGTPVASWLMSDRIWVSTELPIMLSTVLAWSWLGHFNRVRYAPIHIGALYWHFVDAVWLAVFFTFYVTPFLGLRA